jgi:hypothetical protein
MDLDRPIKRDEWPKWSALWYRFWQQRIDQKACKDIARIYYGPFVPKIDKDTFAFRIDGRPFPVDAFLALPLPAVGYRERTATIQRDTLLAIAKRLRSSNDFENVDFGLRLLSAINGEPFAEIGERDDTLWSMAQTLAKRLPHTNPNAIAVHFETALNRMGPDCPTVENFADKIQRAQHQQDEITVANVADKDALRIARIRQAFGTDRTDPYTPEELQSFLEKEQCDSATFTHRWVIQYQQSYYTYRNGLYVGPYNESAAHNAVLRDLSPAPIQLYTIGPQGDARRKSLSTLIQDYGSVALACEADLCAQRTYYDADKQTVVEATAQIDPLLQPEYSIEVDRWWQIAAGDHYAKLCKWVSWLTELSLPCSILFLTGPRGTGKSLLGCGLARLWQSPPTPLSHAMGEYNNRLVDCPFVFGDEDIPRDKRGHMRTAELREFVQARSRLLRRKYLSDTVLQGAVRIMIAANSRGILEFPGQLGYDDIYSIAERILHVAFSNAARAYLKAVQHTHWVDQGTIARHALFLAAQRQPAEGRFLVRDDSNIVRALTVRSGIRSQMCRFLVEYLCQPMLADRSNTLHIRVYEGALLVTPRAIDRHWQVYLADQSPKLDAANKALQALCVPDYVVRLSDGEGHETTYRAVDIENLYAWCRETEFCSVDRVKNALQYNTELRRKVGLVA